jgi:hypothetical protein
VIQYLLFLFREEEERGNALGAREDPPQSEVEDLEDIPHREARPVPPEELAPQGEEEAVEVPQEAWECPRDLV